MLIFETHFTTKSSIRMPNYSIYDTQHPDGTAHGGTAIIIKNNIKTNSMDITTESTCKQLASLLTIGLSHSQLRQSTAPKHIIKTDQFLIFFSTLGHRFLAGETTTPNTATGAPG
jgi:hypothetical protein